MDLVFDMVLTQFEAFAGTKSSSGVQLELRFYLQIEQIFSVLEQTQA